MEEKLFEGRKAVWQPTVLANLAHKVGE